ncbi:MAG: CBS domain-containing protein [Bdellovibrionota bacterium]
MKNVKEKIEQFMTHSPHTVNAGMPIETAQQMMRKYGVRHLPVLLAGHLVGVVSDRDLLLGRNLDREGKLEVDDVMTSDPYSVQTDASLGEVVEVMASRLYGCAVVCEKNGRVVGIFTALDGLREISDRLNAKNRKAAIAAGSPL